MTRIRTKGRAGPAWACALIIGHTLAASAIADDLWISTGVGLSGEGFHTYGGVSYTPFGHLDEDGWRVRAWSKAFQFTYDTTTIKGNKAKIAARGLGLEGETGWYLRGQNWDVLGLIGIVWRDHDLFPPDPAAILARPKLGASATVEARYDLDERWRLSAAARYITGFDELWIRAHPELRLDNGLHLGLATSASLGRDYAMARTGLTVGNMSYEFDWLGRLYFSAEAGYEYNFKTGNAAPFGALHVGYRY